MRTRISYIFCLCRYDKIRITPRKTYNVIDDCLFVGTLLFESAILAFFILHTLKWIFLKIGTFWCLCGWINLVGTWNSVNLVLIIFNCCSAFCLSCRVGCLLLILCLKIVYVGYNLLKSQTHNFRKTIATAILPGIFIRGEKI